MFAHAQDFDFGQGVVKFKGIRINIKLSQIRLQRLQSNVVFAKNPQNQRLVMHGSDKVTICV